MPSSAREYAAMCELELGVAPVVDCGAGVLIPITVDGVEVFEDPGLHECDNASLQSRRLHAGLEPAALRGQERRRHAPAGRRVAELLPPRRTG